MSLLDDLTAIIGEQAVVELCKYYGGQRIYIPHRVIDHERDERIIATFHDTLRDGATAMSAYETCAKQFDLSVRRVQMIIADQ